MIKKIIHTQYNTNEQNTETVLYKHCDDGSDIEMTSAAAAIMSDDQCAYNNSITLEHAEAVIQKDVSDVVSYTLDYTKDTILEDTHLAHHRIIEDVSAENYDTEQLTQQLTQENSILDEYLAFCEAKLALADKKKYDEEIKYNWLHNARANQLPQDNWHTWLILAGRGFGKTRTGAETVRQCIKNGHRRIGLIGDTLQDIEQVMLFGESGLLNVHAPHEKPEYISSKGIVQWPNGAIGVCISACTPEKIRGQQFDCVWIDELAKFSNPDAVYDQINLALRLNTPNGHKPKMIITTTPTSIELIKTLISDDCITKTYGSTFDNAANLSVQFLNNVKKKFEGSKFGKQELYGELLDTSNGLCDQSMIIYKAYTQYDCSEIVIAVDPSVGGSDETGIVVVGVLKQSQQSDTYKYVVLEDASGSYKVSVWPEIVINLYKKYNASCVVAEVNQGGDMIESLLRHIDANVKYEAVRATKSKICRAQPIAMMYEKGYVCHALYLPLLEKQLCSDRSNMGVRSPDRLDALVWALTFITTNYTSSHSILSFAA